MSENPICLKFLCLPLTPDPARNVALRCQKSPFNVAITSLRSARTRPLHSWRRTLPKRRDLSGSEDHGAVLLFHARHGNRNTHRLPHVRCPPCDGSSDERSSPFGAPSDVVYGRARRARPARSRRPALLPPELKVVHFAQADFGRPCDLNPSFVRVARQPLRPVAIWRDSYVTVNSDWRNCPTNETLLSREESPFHRLRPGEPNTARESGKSAFNVRLAN
jgi:hypothetical protein